MKQVLQDRFFYHSFPRPREGETDEQLVGKGLRILSLVAKHGLVLAPEVVLWKQPLQNGGLREVEQLQKRTCFTELSEAEVPEHTGRFGPFALQFNIDTLRELGALPVSYIPQTLRAGGVSAVGATLVAQLFDARHTLDSLQRLRDGLAQLDSLAQKETSSAPNCSFDLCNTDSLGAVVKRYQVPAAAVKDVLDYLSFQNAPFGLTRGVLDAMLSLFYPADDQVNDKILGYYRQREWRIVGGIELNGLKLSEALTPEQATDVREIDVTFWERELSVRFPPSQAETFRRIDRAELISKVGVQKILTLVKSVIVPQTAVERANELLQNAQVRVRTI